MKGIYSLHASFKGESFLKEDDKRQGRQKSKTVTTLKAATTTRQSNLDKILESLSKSGGVLFNDILEDTFLSKSCVSNGLIHLLEKGEIKKEFIVNHGRNKIHSYALIDDEYEPYNPQKEFYMSVLDEIRKHCEVDRQTLVSKLKSTVFKIVKATEYLQASGLIAHRRVKGSGSPVYFYRSL